MDVLKKVDSPVETSLILICEKCAKKISGDGDENIARELQKDLKSEIGERYGKRFARAVVSSCMNICPDGEIAIALAATKNSTSYFTFKPKMLKDAKHEILQHIGTLKT